MAKYGMVIDLERCMGCRACMEACKVENNTPQAVFWMYVFRFEEGQYPNTRVWFLPRPCQHCDNPPCVKVCPVGARYKREDGLVATDWERCIGCRYCQVACPYGVNYFNWKAPKKNYYLDWKEDKALASRTNGTTPPYKNPDLAASYGPERRRIAGGGHIKGVIEKCTFCVQRVEKGLQPACVANCPAFALHFGDLDDPNSIVSRILKRKPHFRLLEEWNTQPRVYYIGQPPGTAVRQMEKVKGRV
ncbi:MAG: 4Fe-4S dicluster domain-containing protein [Dehalococcoidia bacterium]